MARCVLVLTALSWLMATTPLFAGEAKASFSKATIGRSLLVHDATTAITYSNAPALLAGLDGQVLEEYDDITLVEIHDTDKDTLKARGDDQSILVTLRDDFDRIFLNGRALDARDGDNGKIPPGEKEDPPYASNEHASWLIQFIGPIKTSWMELIKAAGVVPVQYIPMHAYIVGARESQIDAIAALPFIQWTSQMHRFLKPSIGHLEEKTVELWIELAQTDETKDAVELLAKMSEGEVESAPWSDTELRVQGVFRTEDIDLILAQPLVFGIAERPTIGLSDERAVLGLTDMVPSVGSPAPEAGKYKKWLSDLCPSCTNLKNDDFYIGIADTGLDGGDRVASGTLPGEEGSTDEHHDDLPKSRVAWGSSFEETTGNWNACNSTYKCPDTTNSKHDVLGHGTLVAGIAAGNPLSTGGKDADGFLWGLGVAPSAGLVITKINSVNIAKDVTPVMDVTRDARSLVTPHAYWQNFSLNQYANSVPIGNFCEKRYDGAYSILSRDFDFAVRDADDVMANNQQLTITTSSGNTHQQIPTSGWQPDACSFDLTLTLPPATAKNVIAVGGAESVRPDPWLCFGTRADSYMNLAMDAKHGTRFAGWYKPDLIAVTTSITSLLSNDKAITGEFCSPHSGTEPSIGETYLPSTGTSFAAPAGLGAAVLASRRFNSDPSAAKPALVKAMLIAGAKSMRGGKDRASLRVWKPSAAAYYPGNRILPTTANEHYYEIVAVGSAGYGKTGSTEPLLWPTNGTTIQDGSGTTAITWLDKGLEVTTLDIKGFPNSQQGFGQISLVDVLSDYPMRAFINQEHPVPVGGSWSDEYVVHDTSLPVRIALVWTDKPKMWESGALSPDPPLVNDLNLSAEVKQSGNCVGRYVGNVLGATEESTYFQTCTGGTHDSLNNAEIIRFFASGGQGNTTFTVKVASSSGEEDQDFGLVVWNAYDSGIVTPPPPTPSNFVATATSTTQVALTWSASPGATSYDWQRSSGVNDPYGTIVNQTTTSLSDGGRSPNTTYLYRVRARNSTGVSDWIVDPATTVLFTDPTLTAGLTLVKAAHVTELRQAVAAIRVAAGLNDAFTWSDNPIVAGTTLIRALHVTELRTALHEAWDALGLDGLGFTDGTLTPGVTVVKRVHIQELRDGV
ncbi:MAG: S8 family serine peptidase [Acidobacteriota bacterium]|nr:S8 family serine peptidase [Acidobacteriota bacterium]